MLFGMMDETAHRRLDIALKIAGVVAIVVGGSVGLWKYFDTAEKEFRKPYWERQISLYFDATTAAATLASSEDPQARTAAQATFWRLYYGPLALVEDRQVEAAMVTFGNCLRSNCGKDELQKLSLALAHACRESLGRAWALKLPDLEGRYNR